MAACTTIWSCKSGTRSTAVLANLWCQRVPNHITMDHATVFGDVRRHWRKAHAYSELVFGLISCHKVWDPTYSAFTSDATYLGQWHPCSLARYDQPAETGLFACGATDSDWQHRWNHGACIDCSNAKWFVEGCFVVSCAFQYRPLESFPYCSHVG